MKPDGEALLPLLAEGLETPWYQTTDEAWSRLNRAIDTKASPKEVSLEIVASLEPSGRFLRGLAKQMALQADWEYGGLGPAPSTECHIEKLIIKLPDLEPIFTYYCWGSCPSGGECVLVTLRRPNGIRAYCACGDIDQGPPAVPAGCHGEAQGSARNLKLACPDGCPGAQRCQLGMRWATKNGVRVTRAYCACGEPP